MEVPLDRCVDRRPRRGRGPGEGHDLLLGRQASAIVSLARFTAASENIDPIVASAAPRRMRQPRLAWSPPCSSTTTAATTKSGGKAKATSGGPITHHDQR